MSEGHLRRLVADLRATNPSGLLSRRRAADIIEAELRRPDAVQSVAPVGRSTPTPAAPAINIVISPPPPRIVYVPVQRRR